MDALFRDRAFSLAALGAGLVVGISGVYMYYKINRSVTREISNLSGTIENLKREIAELKANSSTVATKTSSSSSFELRKSNRRHADSTHSVKFMSVSSVEDEEEFFDVTDTEDVSGSWAAVNGPSTSSETASVCDSSWLDKIDAMLDGTASQKESAYWMLRNRKNEIPDEEEALWRLAKAAHLCGIVAHKRGEMEKKKDLAFEAHDFAMRALEISETNPEIHKWVAIAIGSLGEYIGAREKIANGYIFKEHVDKAIELKPEDPTLHHMLGRWCFEVASLSWLERKAAATLFSAPPESTLEEARTHLLKSDSIKPNWKENLLFISKTFIGEGDYANAIDWIDRAEVLPVQTEDDEIAQIELETLQHQYKSYRSS